MGKTRTVRITNKYRAEYTMKKGVAPIDSDYTHYWVFEEEDIRMISLQWKMLPKDEQVW